MRAQDLLDATVEALDHAVGAGRARLGQSVLDAQGFAELIELVFTAGVLGELAEQQVGELFSVVGQDGADVAGRGLGQGGEEGTCRSRGLHSRCPWRSGSLLGWQAWS